MTTAGVLLAAGRGRRMGTLKQVLPWGASTIVTAAFDAIAGACDAGMIVVVGADGDRVVAALGDRVFTRVDADSDAEQIESIRHGLRNALAITGVRRILLHPADHPAVTPATVARIVRAADDHDGVVIPTHGGRGGHPVLVPAAVAEDVVSSPITGGLREYWREHPDRVHRVEFPDAPELTLDLDTPEDYDATIA
jgi:CTP:molybdopterin cytidylyltransferase MocA